MKNRLSMSRLVSGLLAAGFLCVTSPAWAQAYDSDVCQLSINVVAGVNVAAANSPIDLGNVFDGAIGQTVFAGGGDFTPAQFDITGAGTVDWAVTVTLANLVGGAGGPVTVMTADDGGFCIDADEDGACETTYPGLVDTILDADHDAASRIYVGYKITVPDGASGAFSNASAITLRIDTVLGP